MRTPSPRTLFSIAAGWLFLAANAGAASVVAGIGYTSDFSALPAAADWSTRSFGGTGSTASGEITSAVALDAAVQTNTAALITAQLGSLTGNPPNASGTAGWASAGFYLQTRPTSTAATLLMATLINVTGGDTASFQVMYDYVTNRAANVAEEVRGHRVFYSLSGAANSWVFIPALSQTGQGTLNATVSLTGTWTNGGKLYLLWADDNGSGSPDDANDIDNFFVAALAAAPSCTLAAPTNGASFPVPLPVPLAATVGPGPGATITGVGFFDVTNGFLTNALTSPYTNQILLAAGTHQVYAVATNSLGVTVSSVTNTVTAFVPLVDNTAPAIFTQSPPANATVGALTTIQVTFTENVIGVDASDLLANDVPALSVTGSGSNYTFTIAPPAYGNVVVRFAEGHGIADLASSPNAFNAAGPGATWSYTTLDTVAPSASVSPPPNLSVRSLSSMRVWFDEPVNGVTAGDLLINNLPAASVTGSGAGPYVFSFAQPATGTVAVAWAAGHGITDQATNPFAGGAWTYHLDPALPVEVALSYVVQISLDGLGANYLGFYMSNAPAQFPNFIRLRNEGAFTLNARCDYDASITIPNHASMFTGRPVLQPSGLPNTTQHGYTSDFPGSTDTFHNSGNLNVPYKASMFDVAHDYGRTTAFYAGKLRLQICDRSYDATNGAPDTTGVDNGRDKIDFASVADVSGASISNEVNTLIADLTSATPKEYTFLHIAEPDLTGHASSWGSASWSNAVRNVDAQLGRILSAIDNNPLMSNRTALIVTADHGGGGVTANNHSEAYHIANYTIPFFFRAPGIPGGYDLYQFFANRGNPGTNRTDYTTNPQPLRNSDGSNLALALLGLPPIPGSLVMPVLRSTTDSLRIARFGGLTSVFWYDPAGNYVLEAADALSFPPPWHTITNGIAVSETTRAYTITNGLGATTTFFRLRAP